MKIVQNKKLIAIDEKTLIVGSDIAKEMHYARAQDFRGIELAKPFKYENSRKGLLSLCFWIKNLMQLNNKDKAIVGMEPTGHYWLPPAWFLKKQHIKVVLVNPYHVKNSKELDDNSQTKSDIKDAKVIAQLVKDGRYSEPNMPEGIYAELRVGVNQYQSLVKDLNRVKCRVVNWLDRYFPEYTQAFKDWNGQASICVLRNYPLPGDIADLHVEDILSLWRSNKIRSAGRKRVEFLIHLAQETIGLKEGIIFARKELEILLEQYEILTKQIKELLQMLEDALNQIPQASKWLTIPCIGVLSVATFLSEAGDPSNYQHGRQIIRLAGLNLKDNSSGKHKGKTTITKRGRPLLRAMLYRSIMVMIAKDNEFKALHQYLISRPNNPLKRKQSMMALAGKLIQVMLGMWKNQTSYDGSKILASLESKQLRASA